MFSGKSFDEYQSGTIHMTADKDERAARLKLARERADFRSARAAAIHFNWNPTTYGAHENGTNGFKSTDGKKYAEAFGVSNVWLYTGVGSIDSDDENVVPFARPAPSAPTSRLPILGMAAAGEPDRLIMLNEKVGEVDTPPALEGVEGAYALYVHGTSMLPRYAPTEMVFVHPYKPVAPGNYCVVQVGKDHHAPEGGYIKRFERWADGELVLSQLNPPQEMRFPANEVISMHRIVLGGDG